VAGENVVALCDVDQKRAAAAFARFPRAKKYRDFRKMLDQLQRQIDAVVISTPDHTHAPAAAMALKMDKHCYCEKPLAHSVYEARAVAELAASRNVATQMGTQMHATDNYRRAVELVTCGELGPVSEVHVWCGKDQGGLLWWNNADKTFAGVPADAYWSWGLYDSLIVVVPSLDIVVARAGRSWKREDGADHYDVLKPFLEPIARSVRPRSSERPDATRTRSRSSAAEPASVHPPSPVIAEVLWAPPESILRRAKGSDNWPMTWGDDGRLYTA